MIEAFQIAGAFLLSIGGGGAIIFGLSSWLGKVWANRILENEKAKYSKDLEYFKSELNKEIDKINVINEKALYISKAQYDNEYMIYRDIWSKLHECIVFSSLLYPKVDNIPIDPDEKEKHQKDKYIKFCEVYNDFSMTIDKHAPFYKKEFYNDFITVRNDCNRLGSIFKMYEFDIKYNATFSLARDEKISKDERREVYIEIPKNLEEVKSKIEEEIRDYLLGLQLYN